MTGLPTGGFGDGAIIRSSWERSMLPTATLRYSHHLYGSITVEYPTGYTVNVVP